MRNRLTAAGIRPINNVVDITNYVLMEYGQPLHAFDYDRFGSKEIVTRRAEEGETIETLDGQERELSAGHLVITNGSKPHAIAGVMGGAHSEVHDDTTTILLEAAYFAPAVVRQASKDHGLRSESSSRFEKGVDPNRVERAGKRACELLAEYAGGTVLDGVVRFDELDKSEKQVTIETDRINARLGTEISAGKSQTFFAVFNSATSRKRKYLQSLFLQDEETSRLSRIFLRKLLVFTVMTTFRTRCRKAHLRQAD